MKRKYLTLAAFIFILLFTFINMASAQDKFKPQYLIVSEDNDFINLRGTGTDKFYTNGTRINLFYTKPAKRRFVTQLLMPLNASSDNLYGIGINQLMFTPTDITRTDIVKGERPYAGILFLSHSLSSSDFEHKQKLTTEIDLGVIGPSSFAKEVQIWVHGVINYQKPLGWGNQVKNDFLFNYKLQYEKLLLSPAENFELIGQIGADAGTLNNQITTGINFRMGRFNSYFSNYEKPGRGSVNNEANKYKNFQFFFYVKPFFTAFMDNSLLQGGMFTGYNSVYTIPQDSLTHFYMQFEYDIVIGTKRFGFSVNEKLRTAEFKNADNIQVGNFTFYIGL